MRRKFRVDISAAVDKKEEMLICHASQREWLMVHHGVDEYTHMMREGSAARGAEIGVEYAEGFRQHLGHSFPQTNVLKAILGDVVVTD